VTLSLYGSPDSRTRRSLKVLDQDKGLLAKSPSEETTAQAAEKQSDCGWGKEERGGQHSINRSVGLKRKSKVETEREGRPGGGRGAGQRKMRGVRNRRYA